MMNTALPNTLARALRGFFTEHLPQLRGLSPHTVHSYRDSLTLLLRFAAVRRGAPVAVLDVADLGPEAIIAFLQHLEDTRGNTPATRNVRLAAIHAFFRYLTLQHPDGLEQAQRVLSIPFKRAHPRPVEYLEYAEIQAVLAAVNRTTADGERDYTLLATLFNTGARVQELLDLRPINLQLVKPFQVRLIGKGRKERLCPLWPQTAALLQTYCQRRGLDPNATTPLFVNHRGGTLTRFGVRYLLAKYFEQAKSTTPSLAHKRLHPHTVRHSTAVHLLKAGVDLATISHWLGHAAVTTTNRYATVDLDMKRQAIESAAALENPPTATHWRTDASILEWLEAL
jgi:site-specific recombinase XerD